MTKVGFAAPIDYPRDWMELEVSLLHDSSHMTVQSLNINY